MNKNILQNDEVIRQFGVSIETVRRDFKELVKMGAAKKVYGGIQILSDNLLTSELENWNKRNDRYHEEKSLIAEKALELIPNGATIALDIGTTTYALAKLLGAKRNLTVIISSVRIACELVKNSSNEIFFIGGQLHKEEQVTMGTFTRDFLNHFASIDLFFIGADGFSLDCGITECSEAVADVKRQLIAMSEKNILLADHSKFGKKALFKSCPTENINTLITDGKTPEHYLDSLREFGINIIVV